ncbi:MAG: hypothetical protein N3A66_05160 [Planctomycetota bacterium]|nr:hypothetical protein [Planctomycetota bacterium]
MASKTVLPRGVKIRKINLSRKVAPCVKCGTLSKRHSLGQRRLREVGVAGPTILHITYSKHYCPVCERHFNLPMEHLAQPGSNFTNRVHRLAVELVTRHNFTLEKAKEILKQKYHVHVPVTTIHEWVVVASV